MATGFLISSGADLDDVFDLYVTGTSPSATGFQLSSGTDINTRYAPIVFGSAASPTGYQTSSGADLNTLFAAKNTAAYWPNPLPWGNTFFSNTTGLATIRLVFATSGDLLYVRNNQTPVNVGRYLPNGEVASDFSIRAVLQSGVAASSTNVTSSNQPINLDRFIQYNADGGITRQGTFTITLSKTSNLSYSASDTTIIRAVSIV